MKKDFESRFMPNVKFKLYPTNSDEHERNRIFNVLKNIPNFPVLYFGYRTNFDGSIIYNGFENQEAMNKYGGNAFFEVSVYEAIPESIPEGMRYNKELDKLVPDVIEDKKSVADEYNDGIDLNNDLQDILESDMKYGDKIRAIRNTDMLQKHKHTGGDGNKWYDLPKGANQLQDLIEHKNMNGNIKDVFKACYRVGEKDGTEEAYDVEKMAYYSLRELGRILNTKDYISLATKLMGKQNVKEDEKC